jgi:hypothetical protein
LNWYVCKFIFLYPKMNWSICKFIFLYPKMNWYVCKFIFYQPTFTTPYQVNWSVSKFIYTPVICNSWADLCVNSSFTAFASILNWTALFISSFLLSLNLSWSVSKPRTDPLVSLSGKTLCKLNQSVYRFNLHYTLKIEHICW